MTDINPNLQYPREAAPYLGSCPKPFLLVLHFRLSWRNLFCPFFGNVNESKDYVSPSRKNNLRGQSFFTGKVQPVPAIQNGIILFAISQVSLPISDPMALHFVFSRSLQNIKTRQDIRGKGKLCW